MNADIAVGKMPTLDSFGITLVRITVHYTYKEGTRLMSNVIAFHPTKYDLINLYEVTDREGVAQWGGEKPHEAIEWYTRAPLGSRVLVSAWSSDEEDAVLIGQAVDITHIINQAVARGKE